MRYRACSKHGGREEDRGDDKPRNAVVEKQNWGVRFCCAVGSLIISRRSGGGGGGREVDDGASEVGRLDQKSCATLPAGLDRWENV